MFDGHPWEEAETKTEKEYVYKHTQEELKHIEKEKKEREENAKKTKKW